MAASNFLGTRTEHEELKHWQDFERRQIEKDPFGEEEEVRQILLLKGFNGEILEEAVQIFTKDKDRWVDIMVAEEYGLSQNIRSPVGASASTFTAFFLCGAISLIPFVFGMPSPFPLSCGLTSITFFAVGSFKSKWTLRSWWRSGLESFAIGSLAAFLAYWVGGVLSH